MCDVERLYFPNRSEKSVVPHSHRNLLRLLGRFISISSDQSVQVVRRVHQAARAPLALPAGVPDGQQLGGLDANFPAIRYREVHPVPLLQPAQDPPNSSLLWTLSVVKVFSLVLISIKAIQV